MAVLLLQTGKGRGKKKEKEEPKIKKDYDPEDPDKPYGCECELFIADCEIEKIKKFYILVKHFEISLFSCVLDYQVLFIE